MEAILGDPRSDRGKFCHLVEQRSGVLTGEVMATASALQGLAVAGLVDSLGGDQGAGVTAMSGLPSASLARGRSGRPSLDRRRVGGRRLGGVGGVLVEPLFEVSDLRCSNWPMTPAMMARASVERLSQMCGGIEVGLVIAP
jgi:hypothetical protein